MNKNNHLSTLATFQSHFAINNLEVILVNVCQPQSMEEKDNIYASHLPFQEHQENPNLQIQAKTQSNLHSLIWTALILTSKIIWAFI